MHEGRNFQGTDRQPVYAGRKIRRAVQEQPQEQEETVRIEVSGRPKEITQSNVATSENVREQQISVNSQNRTPQDIIRDASDPKAKLVRSLERNFSEHSQQHLIGVFGINSDHVVSDALKEIQNNFRRNFVMLSQCSLEDDVFRMFGAALLHFIEEKLRNGDFYNSNRPFRVSEAQKMEMLRLIQDISITDSSYDRDFGRLANLGKRFERSSNCTEILRQIKEMLGWRDTKFVWHIEIQLGELNYNLLKSLSKISSDDLIIIVSSITPLEMEARIIGTEFGNPQTGYEILYKYLPLENRIDAD